MAREISINKSVTPLKIDGDRFVALKDWLTREITDAFSARTALESTWRELLRMYEGVPKDQVQDFPIPNAPNIEITLGAIAADSIYAQATDLIWQTKPFATVRATRNDSDLADAVKDLQTSLGTELIIAIDPAVGGLGKRVQGIADLFRTMREQQDLVDAGVIEKADLAWLGLLATQEQLDEAMQQVNQELAKNPELMAEWGRGVEETGTQFAETASEIVGWVEQMRNIKPIPIAEIIKLRELEEEAEAAAEAMTIAQAGITGFTRETILAQAASGQTAGTVTALAKAFGNFSGLAAAATGHLILWQAELAKTGDLDEYMRKVEHLIELYAFIPQEFNTVILAEIRGEENVIDALKRIEDAKRRAGGSVSVNAGGGGTSGPPPKNKPQPFDPVFGLAHGGRWRVGGVGGPDSQLVSFFASPSEEVTVETPAQVAARGSTRNTNIGTQNFFGIDLQEFEEALEDERFLG